MSDPKADEIAQRFAGLTIDEGRALYETLSPEEQRALDEHGVKGSWDAVLGRLLDRSGPWGALWGGGGGRRG